MNAKKTKNEQAAPEHSMKGSFIKSALFHAVIFLSTLVAVPFVSKEPLIITPMSVELVDIADVTQTNKPKPPEPKPVKPKEPEKPKPPEEKPKPKPKPKEPEPVKEAVPPPKPKEPEKPKPKPKPKEPEPKKETQENDFSSLLKDLTPEEDTQTEDTSQLSQLSDKLSMSELDAFVRQIEPCWNVPSGAKFAEDLAVEIRVHMRRDMTVERASVLNKGRYNRDSAYRAAADSALRALRNPRCSPLKLPPEKYQQWKTIVINFDPRNML